MSFRSRLYRALFIILGAVGATLTIVVGVDRALALLCSIPIYTPEFVTMGAPNTSFHYASCSFDCTVHTNSFGLRGPEFSLSKSGRFRIAVLGSSYTYGWGVNDDACFVRLLEQGLRADGVDAEVINLGRNGGSPSQYAQLAEEVVPLLKPDLVIVALIQACDLEWSGPVPRSQRLPHLLWRVLPNLSSLINAPSIPLGVVRQDLPPAPAPTAEEAAAYRERTAEFAKSVYEGLSPEKRTRFDALDKSVRDEFFGGNINVGVIILSMGSPDMHTLTLDMNSEHTRQRIHYLRKYLGTVARAADGGGAPTLVISVPFGAFVNESALKSYERVGFHAVPGMLSTTAPDEAVRMASGTLPFLSVTDAFRQQSSNPKLYFELDLHMAPDGHALFAREILPWVEDHIRAAQKGRDER